MLNKKLVIAALLAACDANTAAPAAGAGTAKTGAGTGAATAPAAGAGAAKTPAAPAKTPAKTPAAPAAPAKLPEETRAAWRDAVSNAVLCDQGNSAMWKAAEKKWKDLTAAKASADTALAAAKKEYDTLNGALTTATTAQASHIAQNKQFLADATATKTVYDGLVKQVAGLTAATALSASTKKTYEGLAKVTTTAEAAVTTQRTRLETLLTLKANNVAEAAAWGTRITALEATETAAKTAKTTAEQTVADARATGTTRAYLFDILRHFDAPKYDSSCDPSKCYYLEQAGASKTVSKWAWDNAAAACTTQGGKTCTVQGNTALAASVKTSMGAARGGSDPTGAWKTLEDADYNYAKAGETLQVTATKAYFAWQRAGMYAQALDTACWPVKGTGAPGTYAFQTTDKYDFCGSKKANGVDSRSACSALDGKNTADCGRYNPLLEKFAHANLGSQAGYAQTQADLIAKINSTRGGFGKGAADVADPNLTTYCKLDGNSKCTKTNLVETKAKAQIALWLQIWSNAEVVRQNGVYTAKYGDAALAANATANKLLEFGKLDTAVTDRSSELAKATGDVAWAKDQQTQQGDDATAVEVDLGRARTLLTTLVGEVATAARGEVTSKAAWDAAVAAEAVLVKAKAQLGAAAVPGGAAATGENAVWAAAQEVQTNVAAQTAFHAARVAWATDNRAPALAKWQAATTLVGTLTTDVASALTALGAAKDACKVAAYELAQAAYTKKTALAASAKTKAAEVKKAYETKTKLPTDGGVGTLCNQPKGSPDGDRVKECKEEEGGAALCCGAAQRYLKNGTRLTIETCQKDYTATYTYYPPLAAGAVEAPLGETWRFQCISGAQKLAAVAAAVLAAGAMIA